VTLALLVGCTPAPRSPAGTDPAGGAGPSAGLRLVAFSSCDDLLNGLRKAARDSVGPYGFGGGDIRNGVIPEGARSAMGKDSVAAPPAAAQAPGAPEHSGTTTHERGADEPDLVKTDGRRIVTVTGSVLRVVDAASRRLTGRLDLAGDDPATRWAPTRLLLSGDTALVLLPETMHVEKDIRVPGAPVAADDGLSGPRLLLVDLSAAPRVVSSFHVDGTLVDARQVGTTARVVVRSTPRLKFLFPERGNDDDRLAANRTVVDTAPAEAWLPRYEITTGDRTRRGQVGCERVSRPTTYSGTSMVTVLSFDLAAKALGDGDPVTVVADGDTVYSNGPSLYVANDPAWHHDWRRIPRPSGQKTEIYRFDTSGPGRPVYAAAGSVPGRLLNQYSLSEWNGHLRVATTTDPGAVPGGPVVDRGPVTDSRPADRQPARIRSESAVYVLRQQGRALTETGRVEGLGRGERIYAVRFLGAAGYVVTFRQTDPLYTLDLTDPKRPTVTGELKITGYSAYLHPVDGGRLIGVGQEASTEGRALGTQVSLFDVSDPRRPARLDQHHVKYGSSEAEFDPHAFLYWPARRLLVVPLTVFDPKDVTADTGPASTAVVLRVGDRSLTRAAALEHPRRVAPDGADSTIRRSLVVGDVLWTVSDAGLQATSLDTLDTLDWLPAT
jgi:hypothetical protein